MKINNILLVFVYFGILFGGELDQQLIMAGKNKKEIKKALRKTPRAHRGGYALAYQTHA